MFTKLILIFYSVILLQAKMLFNNEVLCVNQFSEISSIYRPEKDIACAYYSTNQGWNLLKIETFQGFDNTKRSFAAGFLEGYIYRQLIDYHFININSTIFNNVSLSNRTKSFIKEQFDYSKKLSESSDIDYMETMQLLFEQYRGLYQGYTYSSYISGKQNLIDENDFYLITMQADLEDIIPAFEPKRNFIKEKDCSGFVKFTNDNLIVGHTTHNLYTLMNRIYKHYQFNMVLSSGKKLNDFKYSSRPGDLNSKDDYYILSNNMVVLETSLEIKDLNIYNNLKADTVPKWIRVNVANRLANSNKEWVNIFFRENSGTHNNQWLIVDYNAFNRYLNTKEIKDIVFLVEQIPLLDKIYYEDISDKLIRNTYVASYNAPYFEEVIDTIGYKNSSQDYSNARRKFLFENLNGQVVDISSAKTVLRFHSQEDICDTIAPRCDLVQNRPFGAVDSKITDNFMIKNMMSTIIYGPPHIKGVTEPFNFSNYPLYSHLGIPEYFDFDWINA